MVLQIETLRLLKDNFAYFLRADGAASGAIVDPSEAAPVSHFLHERKLSLDLILCTHHHHDHVGGAVALAEEFSCPIWVSGLEKDQIRGATRGLEESDHVQVAGEEMQILHVPGHTHGQVSFYFPKSHALFVGDTLFSLGCGRLFEGTAAEMFASLKKLARLPDDTRIYFGHEYTLRNGAFAKTLTPDSRELSDYLVDVERRLTKGENSSPTQMGLEKRINPFLNTDSLEEWTRRRELRNVF
jgi:hydroxyacylglutathione hydrolase